MATPALTRGRPDQRHADDVRDLVLPLEVEHVLRAADGQLDDPAGVSFVPAVHVPPTPLLCAHAGNAADRTCVGERRRRRRRCCRCCLRASAIAAWASHRAGVALRRRLGDGLDVARRFRVVLRAPEQRRRAHHVSELRLAGCRSFRRSWVPPGLVACCRRRAAARRLVRRPWSAAAGAAGPPRFLCGRQRERARRVLGQRRGALDALGDVARRLEDVDAGAAERAHRRRRERGRSLRGAADPPEER